MSCTYVDTEQVPGINLQNPGQEAKACSTDWKPGAIAMLLLETAWAMQIQSLEQWLEKYTTECGEVGRRGLLGTYQALSKG